MSDLVRDPKDRFSQVTAYIFQQADTRQYPADQDKEKKWSILRDDYMMGAKMKDWNKESSDDNDGGPGDPDISDSD